MKESARNFQLSPTTAYSCTLVLNNRRCREASGGRDLHLQPSQPSAAMTAAPHEGGSTSNSNSYSPTHASHRPTPPLADSLEAHWRRLDPLALALGTRCRSWVSRCSDLPVCCSDRLAKGQSDCSADYCDLQPRRLCCRLVCLRLSHSPGWFPCQLPDQLGCRTLYFHINPDDCFCERLSR